MSDNRNHPRLKNSSSWKNSMAPTTTIRSTSSSSAPKASGFMTSRASAILTAWRHIPPSTRGTATRGSWRRCIEQSARSR